MAADVIEQRHPIHAWHSHVREHDIARPRIERSNGLLGRRHVGRVQPALPEERHKHLADSLVVVDDQDGIGRPTSGSRRSAVRTWSADHEGMIEQEVLSLS